MTTVSPWHIWIPGGLTLFFFFAFGTVVGSFINVVVYRTPRSIGIVRPASSCPACGTTLTWRENFPLLGWIWLRGRCRFCKSPISAEYPLVELLVGLLFAAVYAVWFMRPSILQTLGMDVNVWRPEWAQAGLMRTWPMVLIVLTLLGSLVAATLVDAKTFTIPLVVPWTAGLAGVLIHPAHAAWFQIAGDGLPRSPFPWTIPVPHDWRWTAAVLAGAAGLGISNALLALGWLRRSFADFEAWEREQTASPPGTSPGSPEAAQAAEHHQTQDTPFGPILLRTLLFTGPGIAGMAIGFAIGLPQNAAMSGMGIGMAVGLVIGAFLRRLVPAEADEAEPIWTQYPHARREMIWEAAFLAPVLLLGGLAWWTLGGAAETPPLWVRALAGSLLGLLAGGGIVWVIRILGTLAFGKEAMGLGDVHLMAAVGACVGWIDPILAFFLAPFFGIAWTIATALLASLLRRSGTTLPYGPHLAAATLLVIFAKPLFESGLSRMLRQAVNLP